MEKNEYKIYKVTEDITVVDDYSDATLYVIQGDNEAMVIDTAMGEGNLPELISEKVTKNPVKLLITHGHGDHVMHAGEFETFYMSALDDVFLENQPEMLKKRIDIKGGDVISVPDVDITVIEAFGHTPGSVVFADLKRKALFTGDAFGSGCGVWMQVNHGLTISEYRDSLEKTLKCFEELGIDNSFTFYGGHIEQDTRSRISAKNTLDIQLVCDMKVLCEKLLSGEITGEESDARHFTEEPARYASYGKAEMIYLASKVK